MPRPLPPPFVRISKIVALVALLAWPLPGATDNSSPLHPPHCTGLNGLIQQLRVRHAEELHYVNRDGKFNVDASLDVTDSENRVLTVAMNIASTAGHSRQLKHSDEMKKILAKFQGEFDTVRLDLSKNHTLDDEGHVRSTDFELDKFNNAYRNPPKEILEKRDAGISDREFERLLVEHAFLSTAYGRSLFGAARLGTVAIDYNASVGSPGNYQRLVLVLAAHKRPRRN